MNTILMYIIQDEKEIPAQIPNNTAYYIAGKKVIIKDNIGQMATFNLQSSAADDGLIQRVEKCENQIEKVIKYLTSFS